MVAKVAGGIVGLGLISAGGIAMAKPHWLGMDYMPSNFHFLSEDNGYGDSVYGSDKFGKKYGKYLVGVTHKKDKPEETNQAWWEWSYRRLKKETKSGKFNNVTNGYGTDDTKDLNKICEEAYKKEASGLKGDGEPNINDNEFKKSDVWKYCSLGGLLTHTDKDKNLYSGKIGGEADNKSKLISVKDSSNDWFWEKRNEDFWATDTNNNWSGSKATGDNNNSIFKKEYETNKEEEENKRRARKTIKKLCEEAYGKDKGSDGTDKNNDNALKFCVLETSES